MTIIVLRKADATQSGSVFLFSSPELRSPERVVVGKVTVYHTTYKSNVLLKSRALCRASAQLPVRFNDHYTENGLRFLQPESIIDSLSNGGQVCVRQQDSTRQVLERNMGLREIDLQFESEGANFEPHDFQVTLEVL